MPYRLYVPAQTGEKYPLVLFLHGGGERGDDNLSHIIANDGACGFVRRQLEHQGAPCYVLAPQCGQGGYGWLEEHVLAAKVALDSVCATYPVDLDRIYLTGMSMGGGGCWRMNYMFPDTFAAVVPMCSAIGVCADGTIDQEAAEQAAEAFDGKPLWIFHAEDDVVVSVETSRALVKALEKRGKHLGQDFYYTEYPGECGYNHGCWNPAYGWELMHTWLFQQTKAPKAMPEAPNMPPPEVMERFMWQEQQAKAERRKYLTYFQPGAQKTPDYTMPYRLYVPEGAPKNLPLVVLLHGIGGCGQDNEMQILDNDSGIDWYHAIVGGDMPPCYLLMPQCIQPIPNLRWELEYLKTVQDIVENVVAQYGMDDRRLYLVGLSLGGYGVWNLNRMYPNRYAAVVSCCPACLKGDMGNSQVDEEYLELCAQSLVHKPLWMFHSEDDMAVPVEITKRMARRLDALGGSYHMTIYPKEKQYNHGCWEPAFRTTELFAWLREQHL